MGRALLVKKIPAQADIFYKVSFGEMGISTAIGLGFTLAKKKNKQLINQPIQTIYPPQ